LHIIGDDKLVEPFCDQRAQARLKIQKDLLGQAVNVKVALESAFGVDQRRVAALSDRQILDVVGYLTVEEPDAIGAGQTDPASKTQIQYGGVLLKGAVFSLGISVVGRDFPPVQLREPGAGRLVKLV
jgi:hypothetical protein